MRRLTHIIVLAAFIFSCGGQWYALQCVAWVKMIHDYSQMVPFTEAIGMTFSGQYPCAICKAIADNKQVENDKNSVRARKIREEILSAPIAVALANRPNAASFQYADYLTLLFRAARNLLPTPPPRSCWPWPKRS